MNRWSRQHLLAMNRLSPKTGRTPSPTYAQLSADPRKARRLRELAREFSQREVSIKTSANT